MVALEKTVLPDHDAIPCAAGTNRSLHRILCFKRTGMSSARAFQGQVERALALDDLVEAYRLVHDSYVAAGYIRPDPTGIRLRPYEASPDMATFVGKARGKVAAVMSIVPDSPDLGLPSDGVFGAELDALRREGRRVAEVTNLAVHPGYRNTNVFFDLTRACFAQTISWRYDNAFIAISPKHMPFFGDVLQFRSWGGPRSYSREVVDIVEGMTMDFRTVSDQFRATDELLGDEAFLHNAFYARNPFQSRCGAWNRQAAKAFGDPGFLGGLFIEHGDLLGRCTANQLDTICNRWGDGLFAAVCGHESPAPAHDQPAYAFPT